MRKPGDWMKNEKPLMVSPEHRSPIIRVNRRMSWNLKKIPPAVPFHSYGRFSDATSGPKGNWVHQGMMFRNPDIVTARMMNNRAQRLKNGIPKKKNRSMALNSKARMMNALDILPSPHLQYLEKMKVPRVEVPGFDDVPLDRMIKHMNPLRGRDKNGFLVSNL